jgi:glycosyltransferase involved in cell wall biosynthesis
MKVLLITWACDLDDISEPAVTARWVREISKDHEVTLFSISKPERFGCVRSQFPDLDVIEWHDYKVPPSLERFRAIVKPGYIPYYVRARRFLKQLLRDKHFDVIHHLSPFAWRYPSPAVGLGVPLVRGPVAGGLETPTAFRDAVDAGGHAFMFLRKTDNFRINHDPVLRSSYRNANHVLMAAPYVRELLAPLSIKSSSIEIEHGIPMGSIPPAIMRAPSPDGKVNLLFVGRIVQTKGLLYAIRALAEISSISSVMLTVIGDGDDLPACRAEVARLGLADNVDFLGWMPKHAVEDAYRRADVFVFPSFREPTGGVLMEAMMYGLPCITCAYGGPDYIVDDTSGIKVEPTTEAEFVSGLATAIDRLTLDFDLRQEMSAMARSRIVENFGWEEKRKRISQLYNKLATRD